jgi:chaperonin GroES
MSAPEPAPLSDDEPSDEATASDEPTPDEPTPDEPTPGGPTPDDPTGSEETAKTSASRDPAHLAAVRRSVAVLGDRVLVSPPDDTERKSKGGILIPATARSIDRKGIWGEAIGVGPHVRQLGVGDEVLYLPEDAIEVDVQGDAFLIVRERDIHAVASARLDSATGLYL